MKKISKKSLIVGFLFAVLLSFVNGAVALPENATTSTPLVSSQDVSTADNHLSLSAQVDQLQQSIQDLRGLIEVQGHEIEQLKTAQQKIYTDLDQRISALSSSKTVVPNVAASAKAMQNPGISKTSDEKTLYQQAFHLISTKSYSDAILGFQNYLKQYPKGQYAANSHYWLAQLYAISGQNDLANQELQTMVTQFSNSPKMPDVMLKLGNMAYDREAYGEAKNWWQKIVTQYPNTSAARTAKTQLQKLVKEMG